MSTQQCDTFESESDPERCRWNNLIEMKAKIHSDKYPINKKVIEMFKFLSKLSCSGPDLDKTKLTTEHNVVVDRSLCDNFCMGQTIHNGGSKSE